MERELWEQLYAIAVPLDRFWTNGFYRTWEIVVVYLWAVVHDRPTSWACESRNWGSAQPRHGLPSQSTMSRRMRTAAVEQLLAAVEAELGGDSRRWWLQRVDSKPLPVGMHSRDPDARYGRAAGGFAKGYKLHAIWGGGRVPSRWHIEPMNVGDSPAARRMIRDLPGQGYVVGDSQFDSNPLHAAAWPAHQVIAPQQRPGKALGHCAHHPARLHCLELIAKPFGQALLRWRAQIERDFGGLTNFAAGLSPLPNWVRRLHRVHLWVQAKLLINAIRLLEIHPQPTTAPA